MIELTPEQHRALRAAAHHLHPVVTVASNGLSDPVLKEIDRGLSKPMTKKQAAEAQEKPRRAVKRT